MGTPVGNLVNLKSLRNKSQASDNNQVACIEYSREDKQKITSALGVCLLAQRTYGKQASDIAKMGEIYARVLNEYQPEKVILAIKEWLLQSPEFPTPCDIKNILEPKPQFSKEVYISIEERRKRGEFISDEEVRYQRKYRNEMMKGI